MPSVIGSSNGSTPPLNGLYATRMRGGQEHRPLSARSFAYVATILHRAFRDAVRWQALVGNPSDAANPPRPGARPEMQTWTGGQLLTWLNHVAANRLSGAW